jgi:hypothetical protein
VDWFGLIVHLAGGLAGGCCAWRFRRAGANDRAGVALAAALGGLIGAQIVERSMALERAFAGGVSLDVGAAIATTGGAVVGGALLVLVMGRIERCFERKRRRPDTN